MENQSQKVNNLERTEQQPKSENFKETTVVINRVAKVVKGGKRFSFNALVVVGDGAGSVGVALGKAKEVPSAIAKAAARAKKSMIKVPLAGNTIPHEVIGTNGAGKVLLMPAAPGTGVIAGVAVRSVLDAVGVKDILTKSLGSSNAFNAVYATIDALKKLRAKEDILKMRAVKTS